MACCYEKFCENLFAAFFTNPVDVLTEWQTEMQCITRDCVLFCNVR